MLARGLRESLRMRRLGTVNICFQQLGVSTTVRSILQTDMEKRAHGVLDGKIGRIKSSNVDPVWLAQKLLTANIIGENDLERAKDVEIPKPERRGELVEIVQGNGRRGVFQTFVNIFLSEPHLTWLGEELQGGYAYTLYPLWCFIYCFRKIC